MPDYKGGLSTKDRYPFLEAWNAAQATGARDDQEAKIRCGSGSGKKVLTKNLLLDIVHISSDSE
jgi:hypothetical protein